MTTATMDLASLKQILTQALRAPSGDNCQPWKFEWRDNALKIYHVDSRGKHRINLKNTASWLALGTLLESIAIAASDASPQTSWESQIELTRLPEGPEEHWATVRFKAAPSARDKLVDALPLRSTDRRLFNGGDFPSSLIENIKADQERFEGIQVHLTPSPIPRELFGFIQSAEAFVMVDTPAIMDALKWVRFDEKSKLSTRDGMPAEGLGMKAHELAAVRMIQRFPGIHPVMCRLGMATQAKAAIAKSLSSSAGLVCITAPVGQGLEPASFVNVGRLALRSWLHLTLAGYGVQPLTLSSLYVRCANAGLMDGFLTPDWINLYRSGEPVIRQAFSLPQTQTPVWMFRTGLSSALPESRRTLRLEQTDLLKS
jgi:hypothetical protein